MIDAAALFEAYQPLRAATVVRLNKPLVLAGWDREDAAQESAAALWELLRDYDAERGVSLGGYLKHTMPYKLYNAWRGAKRRCRFDRQTYGLLPGESWHGATWQPEKVPTEDDLSFADARLDAAWRALSRKQRRVLFLTDGQGLPEGEAARLLGVTKRAVNATRHRGLAKLRAALGVYTTDG